MAIVNGKIVRKKKKVEEPEVKKAKKSEKERKRSKPMHETISENKKKSKPAKEKKSEKPSKKTAKEDFIRTGEMSAIQISLGEYNGKDYVQIRKMYRTKADPEMRIGSGGMNIDPDKKTIDALIARLKEIREEL